jgi:hypothetical protein
VTCVLRACYFTMGYSSFVSGDFYVHSRHFLFRAGNLYITVSLRFTPEFLGAVISFSIAVIR